MVRVRTRGAVVGRGPLQAGGNVAQRVGKKKGPKRKELDRLAKLVVSSRRQRCIFHSGSQTGTEQGQK